MKGLGELLIEQPSNPLVTFHFTGWFIGTIMAIIIIPMKTGEYNPLYIYKANNQCFGHFGPPQIVQLRISRDAITKLASFVFDSYRYITPMFYTHKVCSMSALNITKRGWMSPLFLKPLVSDV